MKEQTSESPITYSMMLTPTSRNLVTLEVEMRGECSIISMR
jgi:hypothetical protein